MPSVLQITFSNLGYMTHKHYVMFYTPDTQNCRPLQNSNRQESRYSHEPNSAVHRDAGEKREAASIDRLKLVLETSAGNRLRSPASLSSAAWPDPSGKQRPTTRNRLKNNSSKIGLIKAENARCIEPSLPNKSTACALWRRTPGTAAELRVNDDRAIRRRASRLRRPTRARATRHNSDAPKADRSLPSRSRSSSGSSRSTRSQDRNSPREQMQPRASSLECRPRPDRQVNL